MASFNELSLCICCGSADLKQYLDLGQQPLANNYHNGYTQEEYPLAVRRCQSCHHNQLSVSVTPETMFKEYLYVSGTTQTFRDHCQALAEHTVDYYRNFCNSCDRPKVLDIACNDGTLLASFHSVGCDVFGVDPAENLRQFTEEKDIPVAVQFWGPGAADALPWQPDIITGTNVFAHVPNVNDFLAECHKALAKYGLLVLEFPYCNEMIAHFEFDTIYHEHISYWLVYPFLKLIERQGFYVKDIVQTKIHGGSIRFLLSKQSDLLSYLGFPHNKKVYELIYDELDKGLYSSKTYEQFSVMVEKNMQDLRDTVHMLQKGGKHVCGYGASAKGNTMLNKSKIRPDFIVDDNPLKWGLYTPGQDIMIEPPQKLAEYDELYIVILAWNFYDEIVRKIENICGKKHNYVCYVPTVQIK